MSKVMLSLCDVNIAKNIRPTWDYRQNVGEGSYGHSFTGGIPNKNYEQEFFLIIWKPIKPRNRFLLSHSKREMYWTLNGMVP